LLSLIGFAAAGAKHRKRYPLGSGARERCGQSSIVLDIRGRAEINPNGNLGGSGVKEPLKHNGMVFSRPWPAGMALQALAINRHKHDLAAGGTREQPAAEVMQMTFNEIEGTSQVKKRHQAPNAAKN
jgi:hypothetical protein